MKTWLDLFFVAGGFLLLTISALSCGVHKLCRKPREARDTHSVGYSVAVSNHMFKEDR